MKAERYKFRDEEIYIYLAVIETLWRILRKCMCKYNTYKCLSCLHKGTHTYVMKVKGTEQSQCSKLQKKKKKKTVN